MPAMVDFLKCHPISFPFVIMQLITIDYGAVLPSNSLQPNFDLMHPVSIDLRDRALVLLRQGKSTRDVAEALQLSKSYVHKLRQKHLSDLPKPPSGRARKLSDQNERFCVRAITSGKLQTAVRVRQALETDLKISVSERTIRRALNRAGLRAAEKEKLPALSAKNIKARLDFARRYRHYTVEDWKRVIWSDETKICRFGSDGRFWCWERDGEGLQPRNVRQTVKHGGGSLMIWACMTAAGPGFMCRIDGIMDQHLYKEILEGDLMQTVEYYGFDVTRVVFQQDNDPKHRAASVLKWLEEQPFTVLEWPSQSPDLNPIENLWATLKRRLNEYEHPPRGMVELWERIECEWEKITAAECLALIESMPRRIEALLKAKGRWIGY